MKAKAEIDGLELSQDPWKWQEIMESYKDSTKTNKSGWAEYAQVMAE